MFSKTLIKTIIIALSLNTCFAKEECPNMIYIGNNQHITHRKRYSTRSFPGKDIFNYLNNAGVAEKQFDPLDFNEYELMEHALYQRNGILIYRVCPKGTDYHKYGPILAQPMNGYLMKVPSMKNFNRVLITKYFDLNGVNIKREIEEMNKENEIRKQTEWENKIKGKNHLQILFIKLKENTSLIFIFICSILYMFG